MHFAHIFTQQQQHFEKPENAKSTVLACLVSHFQLFLQISADGGHFDNIVICMQTFQKP